MRGGDKEGERRGEGGRGGERRETKREDKKRTEWKGKEASSVNRDGLGRWSRGQNNCQGSEDLSATDSLIIASD